MESSFRNRENAAQLIDFAGLKFGLCSPTDIDMSIDWRGLTFVFVEIKRKGMQLTIGQRLHLEGVVKAINAGGKHAVALFAHHQDIPVGEDVFAADCIVHSAYGSDECWVRIEDTNVKDYMKKIYVHHLNRNNLTH